MSQLIDRIGQRFGKLTILEYAGRQIATGGNHLSAWLCLCDCGNTVTVRTANLTNPHSPTKSCGCWRREFIRPTQTHGQSGSRTHRIWAAMKARCNNKKNKDYGGRGIHYCVRWKDFENFLTDMGEAPEGMSIERMRNNGDYEPGNCKWATRKEQNFNKRNNRYFEHDGRRLQVADWAKETGVSRDRILNRIDVLGWSVADALSTPARKITKRVHAIV